jgi:hypothetical protein
MLQLVPLALKLVGRKRDADEAPRVPGRPSTKLRLFAILPVLVTIVAFVLSFLCVYAGHTPGMMEEYAIFTLNVSRIGQNWRQEIDSKITNFDFNFKRSVVIPSDMPTATVAPTTLITLAPRGGIGNKFSSLTKDAGSAIDSAETHIKSDANSVKSKVESKADSITSAVGAQATEIVGDLKTEVIHLVNEAFSELVDGLDLRDFYSVHVMTTCEGEYELPNNGGNITIGQSPLPPPGTHKVVDKCSKHSAVDPLSFLNVFYWIGIVFTGIAMLAAFAGAWFATWKLALVNILATGPAFCMMGLSSALAHGVAVGVPKLIDFIGGGIGIDGMPGDKFLQLTWGVVILLFINMCLWCLLLILARREHKKVEISEKEAYQMQQMQR